MWNKRAGAAQEPEQPRRGALRAPARYRRPLVAAPRLALGADSHYPSSRNLRSKIEVPEMDLKVLEKEALRLPAEDRAALAQKLLLSLDDLPAAEHAELWLAEADRRARQLDRGEVEPIPADEVRRKARALLR